MRKAPLALAGGVATALLGALCCIGPVLFVMFGVGAGLAATFEPLRPVLGIAALSLFGVAAYTVYGRPQPADAAADCGPGETCAAPRNRKRDIVIFWVAVTIALILWTFPTWSVWLA